MEGSFFADPVYRVVGDTNPHGKPIVKSISTETVPTGASLEPAYLAHLIGEQDEAFRSLLGWASVQDGPIIAAELVDVLDTEHSHAVHRVVESVLQHDFNPTPTPHAQGVLHIPTFALLYNAMARLRSNARILVVGSNATDLKRVLSVRKRHFERKNLSITFLTKDSGLSLSNDHVCVVRTVASWDELPGMNFRNDYDFVFLPHSLGHLLASGLGVQATMDLLRTWVIPVGGIIGGVYFDVDALKQMSIDDDYTGGTDFHVYSESRNDGPFGSCLTRVGNLVFKDYRVDIAAITDCVSPIDDFELKPARPFIAKYPPPAEMKKEKFNPRLEPMRVFLWTSGVGVSAAIKNAHIPYDELMRPTRLDLSDVPDLVFAANRGKPFNDGDLFFLVPEKVYVTPKANGVESKIAFTAAGTFMVERGSSVIYELACKGPPGLQLHVEHIKEAKLLVVADVCGGVSGDTGYYGRMISMGRIQEMWNLPFIMPPCVKLGVDLRFPPAFYPTDGYVLNYETAMPGVHRDGYGSARYLKDVYTIDRERQGVIVECNFLTGEAIRNRPDKTQPSSTLEEDELRTAWTTAEFRKRVTALQVRPRTIARFTGATPPSLPIALSNDELIYIWCPWRPKHLETRIAHVHGTTYLAHFQAAAVRQLHAFRKMHATEFESRVLKRARKAQCMEKERGQSAAIDFVSLINSVLEFTASDESEPFGDLGG